MSQKQNYNLVRQTLADLLQSKYETQRNAGRAALKALEDLAPSILPELTMVPDGYALEDIYYAYKLEMWGCIFTIDGKPSSENLQEYGQSPREAFMAIVEKIERKKATAA